MDRPDLITESVIADTEAARRCNRLRAALVLGESVGDVIRSEGDELRRHLREKYLVQQVSQEGVQE